MASCATNLSAPHKAVRQKILKTKTSSTAPKSVPLGVFFCFQIEERLGKTVKHFRVLSGLFVALLFVVTAQTAMAQSTIFNIPSTDTVSKGKGYFGFDFLAQAPGTGTTRTYIYNPRVLVGVGSNVEAGVNFPVYHGSGAPSPNNFGYIQPNVKVKYFNNDDKGVALFRYRLEYSTQSTRRSGQLGIRLHQPQQEGEIGQLWTPVHRRSLRSGWCQPGLTAARLASWANREPAFFSDTNSRSMRKRASSLIGLAARTDWVTSRLAYPSHFQPAVYSTSVTALVMTVSKIRI